MKTITARVLPAFLYVLIVTATPGAGEPDSIISEWNASIQIIRTEAFSGWPGVVGKPLDTAASNGRIWLVWPHALVGMNAEGKTDARSLLALFASQHPASDGRKWTPEGGLMDSDGAWTWFESQGGGIGKLDASSGRASRRRWDGSRPQTFDTGFEGALLTIDGDRAALLSADGAVTVLDTDLPPLTSAAACQSAPLVAWMEAGSGTVSVAGYGGERGFRTKAMPGTVWAMDWAGRLLVLAGPGRLTALDFDGDGPATVSVLEDERLPDRWYRVRGGAASLLIHSPETGTVAVIRENQDAPADRRSAMEGIRSFPRLLEDYALEAGAILEESGRPDRAEAYYGWVLPHIRDQRSRWPLAESWPDLEQEITRRRAELRDELGR